MMKGYSVSGIGTVIFQREHGAHLTLYSMPRYLTKFTQCRDELGSVGATVDDEDLVSLALLGLPKSWHSYQDSVNGHEKLPGWERL